MSLFNKHPKKYSIPLNAIEKFMLAHESEEVAYNSQIMVEFDGVFQADDFYQAIKQAIDEIPLLRSRIAIKKNSFCRYYFKTLIHQEEDVFKTTNSILDQRTLDEFCHHKFDLKNSPPFCFLLAKTIEGKNILIFNVHHTLCDAAGQFHLLEEFFRVVNKLPIRNEAKSDQVFRYRDLRKYMGIKWFISQMIKHFKPLSKQRQYKMATLIDHPEKIQRHVTSITFSLSDQEQSTIRETCRKNEVSITEHLTCSSFRALDKSLRHKGDFDTPIMIYLPKTLRPLLKIRYSLQNILTTVWIVAKRKDIHSTDFLGKIKIAINAHKMDSAAKIVFGSLWACSFLRPGVLQEYFKKLDQNSQSFTSSLLISAGRVPRSFAFPANWSGIRVWARGTMLKSPGVGVIFTGVAGSETITIEYLRDLTDRETIENFKENLMLELLS